MRFTVGRYDFELALRARWPWTHMRIHRREGQRHFVWGRFSVLMEDWRAEIHPVCAQCGSMAIKETRAEVSWCEDCRCIEGGYRYVNLREYEGAA